LSTAALAAPVANAGWSPGWIAGYVMVIAAVGGLIAFASHDDDDHNDSVIFCQ
jgi:hypothetical protein